MVHATPDETMISYPTPWLSDYNRSDRKIIRARGRIPVSVFKHYFLDLTTAHMDSRQFSLYVQNL